MNKKYNDDFQKVVISNAIPDALRDLHTSKHKKPCNKPEDGCLWKPAKRNNVHPKQLRFETRLYGGVGLLIRVWFV